MRNESKLQKMFREDMTTNKTEEVVISPKVLSIISMVGLSASAFLFGWSLYNHVPSKMILFGMMMLVCAASFIKNAKAKKK